MLSTARESEYCKFVSYSSRGGGGQGADLVSKAVKKGNNEGQNFGSKYEGMKWRSEVEQYQGSKPSSSPLAGLYPMYSTSLLSAPGFQPDPFHPFSKFSAYTLNHWLYRPMGGMERRNTNRLACHFCDSTTHLFKDCELMKAVRKKQNESTCVRKLVHLVVRTWFCNRSLFIFFK